MNVLSSNLNLMIKAGEKASKRLIRDFGEVENLQVSIKGPTDFVSNADINAERIIIEELSKLKKNYSILSEETGFVQNQDEQLKVNIPNAEVDKLIKQYKKIKKRQKSNLGQVKKLGLLDKNGNPLT